MPIFYISENWLHKSPIIITIIQKNNEEIEAIELS